MSKKWQVKIKGHWVIRCPKCKSIDVDCIAIPGEPPENLWLCLSCFHDETNREMVKPVTLICELERVKKELEGGPGYTVKEIEQIIASVNAADSGGGFDFYDFEERVIPVLKDRKKVREILEKKVIK